MPLIRLALNDGQLYLIDWNQLLFTVTGDNTRTY